LKIGILSDAHGNAIGLRECMASLKRRNVRMLVSLGDCVGYFPEPNKVLETLRSAGALCLMGNHEAMLIGLLAIDKAKEKVYQIRKSRRKISQKHFRWISKWVPFRETMIDGARLLLVHGSPWDPLNGYVYPDSDLRGFTGLEFDAVFMGHTHRPFMRRIGKLEVVNVGSCGLPRDNKQFLTCAIYDSERKACEIIRVSLDINELVQRYGRDTSTKVIDRLRASKDPRSQTETMKADELSNFALGE
jgi:predicted phosphodiesterase